MIRFENVGLTYEHGVLRRRRRQVLAGVDWTVTAGESVALAGPSGSGKSTMIRLALGLTAPTDGSVRIAGFDPARVSRREAVRMRRIAQWVPQHPDAAFDPRMTIRTAMGEVVAIHRLADGAERIAAAAARMNLSPRLLDRRPRELSGGEVQRFAIARALLLEPQLLLLDEPTSMLDMSVQAEIAHLLMGLRREENLTLVFVTHDRALAAHVADRVDVIANGTLQQGTTRELA